MYMCVYVGFIVFARPLPHPPRGTWRAAAPQPGGSRGRKLPKAWRECGCVTQTCALASAKWPA